MNDAEVKEALSRAMINVDRAHEQLALVILATSTSERRIAICDIGIHIGVARLQLESLLAERV